MATGEYQLSGDKQLHDLTGRPGVDVRRGAFADLLPQVSPHRLSSALGANTGGEPNTDGGQSNTPPDAAV